MKKGRVEHQLEAGQHGLSYMKIDGTGASGTDCTNEEFLEGYFVDLVRTIFGEKIFSEVTEVVNHNISVERQRGKW